MADPASALENPKLPKAGDVIAQKYQVESVIGIGGMGVVVAARHLQLGQTVAIKLLSAEEQTRREAIARFLREAQAAAGLRSDHVVRIYDVGMLADGLPFMVMELLRGADLGKILDHNGKLSEVQAVDYVLQACDAIAEAHELGIVHRDLKPSNLFLSQRSDGAPLLKVLDFGISKSLAPTQDGALTSTRSLMGSPYYMSPEQVRDAKKVDGRTDIWSLGVILYEFLLGEPAFQADTLPGVCAAIVADPPAPIRLRRPEISVDMEQVILRCLEKDPTRRFQTVRELIVALNPHSSRARGMTPSGVPEHAPPTPPTLGRGPVEAAARSLAAAATISSSGSPRLPISSGGSRSAKVITGDTKTQLSADMSTHRSQQPAGSLKRNLLLGGAFALALVGGLGLSGMLSTARKAEAPAPPNAAAQVQNFTLTIDSTPAGAVVWEDQKRLGETPLSLSLSSTGDAAPRAFKLSKPGFKTYVFQQAAARSDVRIHAALVEEPSVLEPVASSVAAPSAVPNQTVAATARATAAAHPQKTSRPTAPTSAPPSDIRLKR